MAAKSATIPWDAEHNEPDTNDAAATQVDDASVIYGSPGQASATVDTDDAHSAATGIAEAREMGRIPSQTGWQPYTMDNIQLRDWMEQMGASKETLEELLISGTDGSELMFCMDIGHQSNDIIEMVETQPKLAGSPLLYTRLRPRLTCEAEDERQDCAQARRREVQAEKAKLECETLRMQQEKLAGNPLLHMWLRPRLTSEAEDERQEREQARRMEVQAEKTKLECETLRMQQEKLAGNPLLHIWLRPRLTSEAEDKGQGRERARRREVQAEKAKLECEMMRKQHAMDMTRYETAALAKKTPRRNEDANVSETRRQTQMVGEKTEMIGTANADAHNDASNTGVSSKSYLLNKLTN